MNRNIENTEMFKRAKKLVKRVAITILCSIPIVLIFAYLTKNIITSDAGQIACYVVIMGTAVAIVEPIARAREKKKAEQAKVEPKRDVFK